MQKKSRDFKDRVRHTILFEAILVGLATPILTIVGNANLQTAAVSAMSLSVIAMVWNFVFNLMFDKWMLMTVGTTTKSKRHRMYNAIYFELGLLGLSLPVIAYALNISLFEALILDLGFAVFALFYSYSFNYLYDKCFPLHTENQEEGQLKCV